MPEPDRQYSQRENPYAHHFTHDGYTFRADAQSLTIVPGPKPITLNRAMLEQLGLVIREDYQTRLDTAATGPDLIGSVLSDPQRGGEALPWPRGGMDGHTPPAGDAACRRAGREVRSADHRRRGRLDRETGGPRGTDYRFA